MSHLQLSFYGRGGDQHGQNGVSVSDTHSGVLNGRRFHFGAGDSAGGNFVFISARVQHRTF